MFQLLIAAVITATPAPGGEVSLDDLPPLPIDGAGPAASPVLTPQQKFCLSQIDGDTREDRWTYWSCVSEGQVQQQMTPEAMGEALKQ